MVSRYFSHFSEPDFARSGTTATQKVVINEGPLPAFSHSMEPQLRQLGLPTTLVKGRWMLLLAQCCETHSVEPSCSSYCAVLSQSCYNIYAFMIICTNCITASSVQWNRYVISIHVVTRPNFVLKHHSCKVVMMQLIIPFFFVCD